MNVVHTLTELTNMRKAIRITKKDGMVITPMLSFEYSDIQAPVVLETEDKITISYFRELGYDEFELTDPWSSGVHLEIFGTCRGYFSPQHLCAWGEEDDELPLSQFFNLDEYDGAINAFNPDNTLPCRYIKGVCHGDVHWRKTDDANWCDAVLYATQECVEEVRKHYEDAGAEIQRRFDYCMRMLNGDQFYMHNTIEIDKATGEHADWGMLAYIWEENCTQEMLSDSIPGEPCQYELIDVEDIITPY